MYLNQTMEVESDPSTAVLEEDSAGNLPEALVGLDKAGHDSAPITGPTSTTPFEGLFHTGLLEQTALPSPVSELSTTAMVLELSTGGGEAGTTFGDDDCAGSEAAGACSAAPVARDEEEDDDDGGDS